MKQLVGFIFAHYFKCAILTITANRDNHFPAFGNDW
jgi:hypothetical protein